MQAKAEASEAERGSSGAGGCTVADFTVIAASPLLATCRQSPATRWFESIRFAKDHTLPVREGNPSPDSAAWVSATQRALNIPAFYPGRWPWQ
jgi:hypothetical protein